MRASSSVGTQWRIAATGTCSTSVPIIVAGILTASLPLAAQEEPLRWRLISSIVNATVRRGTASTVVSM